MTDRVRPGTRPAPLHLVPRAGVTPVLVGIDVVDLGNPRTEGKVADDRFLNRVYAVDEVAAIRCAEDPELDLWCRWAAKEAAFKVVSKVRGTPPAFVHRSFVTDWQDAPAASNHDDDAPLRSGLVRYENFHAPILVRRAGNALHAVAFGRVREAGDVHTRVEGLQAPNARWSAPLSELEALLSERERDAVHSLSSAAVRIGARGDLADSLGVGEERLEIVCAPGPTGLRPPHVLLDGEPTHRADVSLSHDGPWIAWAIWVDGRAGDGAGATRAEGRDAPA